MIKARKILVMIFALCFCLVLFAGCQKAGSNAPASNAQEDNLSIVCTIFPEYDWVKEIVGNNGNAEITLLLDNGVDLHSYQPTAEDIIKIADCDMFIYVGGESDGWVEDCLKEATNKDMVVINLLDVLGDSIKEEEVVEGMQPEEEEETEEGEEEVEYDEHVWLSLKNASILCQSISDSLCKLDEKNAESYKTNTEKYLQQLSEIDGQFQQAVDSAEYKTVLFGDRFPFRYFVDDYNLEYYAAFVGCSAETEASFETVVFLAGKMDQLKLPAICVIENSDHKIAETILENTTAKDQKILVMNSMQSVTGDDVEKGTTYLSIMKENLEVLKSALNRK
ncbi:MAG: metal ABC transporter substrate-binding protein [Lachnospiraceae bacterium]|nr:metal ABC transporter substrate-binding protein [Lachnospiraceae bacterium]